MRAYYRKKAGIPEATRPCPSACECCNRPMGTGKQVHLDHDHVTGKFRGWLCNSCNLGIGALGDDIKGLRLALAYLKRAL
jgi:Recombination endonuclease VII